MYLSSRGDLVLVTAIGGLVTVAVLLLGIVVR